MIHNELASYFDDIFTDKRIVKRANQVLDSMIKKGSSVVGICCSTIAQRIGAYRMFKNKKMSIDEIKEGMYRNCVSHIRGHHVLCIQDTSEINYTSHLGRIGKQDSDIGPVVNDSNGGFFCHPTLVIDAQDKVPLGFLNVKLSNRSWEKKNKKERNYPSLDIQKKESYRWIESVSQCKERLPQGVKQTVIADRESDIYEALHLIPDQNCDLLIRSSSNRRLEGEEVCIREKMRSLPDPYSYQLEIKGSHNRKSRTAYMHLRYCKVSLSKPKDLKGDYPLSIELYCIYAVEDAQSVPKGETPIEWRLLTTHQVESPKEALQCVEWYKQRWYIEEIFRLVKSEGMDVESAQLESGEALKKLLLMALIAAWHIMALKLAYDTQDDKNPAAILFTQNQLMLLGILLPSLEGKTEKQKNPYEKGSFVWAAWIVARLGGWSGYQSQSGPGYITFKQGYRDFMSKYEAFEIFKDVYSE